MDVGNLAMPTVENSTRWTGVVLEEGTTLNVGPLSPPMLKDQLDCGCYAVYQLLGNRLACDEGGFTAGQLVAAYWNCWRRNFEKELLEDILQLPFGATNLALQSRKCDAAQQLVTLLDFGQSSLPRRH